MHFSKKLVVPLIEKTNSKAKSFSLLKSGSKSTNKLTVVVAYHSNTVVEYSIDLAQEKSTKSLAKAKFEFG